MAQNTRHTPVRRRSATNGSSWRLLLTAFLLGLGIMWAVEHMLNGGRLSGLRKLFAHHPATEQQASPSPVAAVPPKPTFDFYTILPEIGNTMPEAGMAQSRGAGRKSANHGVRYVLQAAAYSNNHDADRLRARLALQGIESYTEKISVEGRGSYFRVRLGPFTNVAAMDSVDRKLARLGIRAIPLKVKAAPGP